MEELLSNLMQKFAAKAKLFESNGVLKPTTELVAFDVNKKANRKSLMLIEIGTKARAMFARNLLCDKQQDLFRKECQKFYAKAVSYFQESLPFDVLVLRYLQYLHPEKRNNSGSTDAIRNLAFQLTRIFSKSYCKIFHVPSTVSAEEVCGKIRFQGVAYQLQSIPSDYYSKSDSVTDLLV